MLTPIEMVETADLLQQYRIRQLNLLLGEYGKITKAPYEFPHIKNCIRENFWLNNIFKKKENKKNKPEQADALKLKALEDIRKIYSYPLSGTVYNQYDDRIFNTTYVNIITMNTYNADYDTFINTAAQLQTSINDISRIGLGMLTNYGSNMENPNNSTIDITDILLWSKYAKINTISLWASHISPYFYIPLYDYLH